MGPQEFLDLYVERPFTNMNAVFEATDGMRSGIGGSCRQVLNKMAPAMREAGHTVMLYPTNSFGNTHTVLATETDESLTFIDPVRRWIHPIVVPHDAEPGSTFRTPAYPQTDTMRGQVTLLQGADSHFSMLSETHGEGSVPHETKETFHRERKTGILSTPIFDALNTLVRNKLEMIIAHPETGSVFDITLNLDRPDSMSMKEWGKERVRRKSTKKFEETLMHALFTKGLEPEYVLECFSDASERTKALTDFFLDEQATRERHEKERDALLAAYAQEGGSVAPDLIHEADHVFSGMRTYFANQLSK